MTSSIYNGTVIHKRFKPKTHFFKYNVFSLLIDLSELEKLDKTIKFFSYNNGISATAEKIVIENDKILKINDFQIVNGGQTTATIHYSRRRDKYSLKDVFIAVKIGKVRLIDNFRWEKF